jgi:hypothetical protein
MAGYPTLPMGGGGGTFAGVLGSGALGFRDVDGDRGDSRQVRFRRVRGPGTPCTARVVRGFRA